MCVCVCKSDFINFHGSSVSVIPVTGTGCTSLDISVNTNLELVDKFCYLGDMLGVDRDAGVAVENRI